MEQNQESTNLCSACSERPIKVKSRALCYRCNQLWLKSPERQHGLLVARSRSALLPCRFSFMHPNDFGSCEESRASYARHDAEWEAARESARRHYEGQSDDNIVVLAAIKVFQERVNELEEQSTHLGVQGVPQRPEFMNQTLLPLERDAQASFLKALDERFQAINDRLLDAEDVGSGHSTPSFKARQLGRYAHSIYERSKPLFWEFGVQRSHRHYIELLAKAMVEIDNPHYRTWLSQRGMYPM